MNIADSKDLRKFKKDTQFFETPEQIAVSMANFVGLGRYHRILEPSAGRGALLHALYSENQFDWWPEVEIHVCEKHEPFREELDQYFELVGSDFLEMDFNDSPKYDFILMNPPYSKDQAIRHVRYAWNFLKTGGRIVALLPEGRQADKLREEFVNECVNFDVQPKAFAETKISTVIMTIDKPIW